jgi:hypothetical protein
MAFDVITMDILIESLLDINFFWLCNSQCQRIIN